MPKTRSFWENELRGTSRAWIFFVGLAWINHLGLGDASAKGLKGPAYQTGGGLCAGDAQCTNLPRPQTSFGGQGEMTFQSLPKAESTTPYLLLIRDQDKELSASGHAILLAKEESLDDLFEDAPKKPAKKPAAKKSNPKPMDKLFGTPSPKGAGASTAVTAKKSVPPKESRTRISGFFQNELAYAYKNPDHWSKLRNTLEVSAGGSAGKYMKWKIGGRLLYDPVYDGTGFYGDSVAGDQRYESTVRETYLDISLGEWDFRLGRQHVVWGEAVGLFFADVVSAKDLREFVLPDFDMLRIPQWAARAEYFHGNFHAEALWIPYITYDKIGVPGSEFYPFNPRPVPGFQTVIAGEDKPRGSDEMAYGLRLSHIWSGWDLTGFYYSTNDGTPAFSRQISPGVITYTPIHERIHQWGLTLGKDLRPVVLKAEAIYTKDRLFSVTTPADLDGLVEQDLLDYVIGLDWAFPKDTRVNAQVFQRWFPDHDPDMILKKAESGFSLLLSTQALHSKVESELLWVKSLNRDDWLAQFKITWKAGRKLRLAAGADVFHGPQAGLFGQFGEKDRVYTEIRYSF
jgi:hypothetical protein